MSLVKNLPIQLWETEEENRIKDQSIKNLRTWWGNVGGKPKDHRYCWWRNLPTWTNNRERKDWWREEGFVWGGTWMIRDLVKIKCCLIFSRVELQSTKWKCRLPNALYARETDLWLPESNYNNQTTNIGFWRSLRQGDRSPAICWPLALLENQIDSDFSLSPLFCHFV